MKNITVQIAIDATNLSEALDQAALAMEAGADRLEVGHPLIIFEGFRAVKTFSKAFPEVDLLIDLMILAGSEKYIRAAEAAGARQVTVCGFVPKETIEDAIRIGRETGIEVIVDLFNLENLVEHAQRFEAMGASEVMVHYGVDQKRNAPEGSLLETLTEVAQAVQIPVSYATYDADEARAAQEAGARVLVQGEPLTSHPDAQEMLVHYVRTTKKAADGCLN